MSNRPDGQINEGMTMTFFIHSAFHRTLIRPAASVSEVTTVWCYINSIIIIIIYAQGISDTEGEEKIS